MSTAPEEMHDAFPEWTFGDRLRKARRHAGLSQQEMADAIGVPIHRLSNWEAGYNLPRDLIGTAGAVATATGVDQVPPERRHSPAPESTELDEPPVGLFDDDNPAGSVTDLAKWRDENL